MPPAIPFAYLPELATHLREMLDQAQGNKKCVLLYAYNGTGKTRLSMEFKNLGKAGDYRDTLYFNAFTEDLFSWDNDLDGDADRKLRLNRASKFFRGLAELEMDTRIRALLRRYADFDFVLETPEDQAAIWFVRFFRPEMPDDPIKVSRGEENIFVWCFFLAIAELAIEAEEGSPYAWVKHLYIDDPISSLDEHNAITVACQIAELLRDQDRVRAVISTHHTLFFNVLCNEFKPLKKRLAQRFLAKLADATYEVRDTRDTPSFHHVAMLVDLQKAADSGALYPYHFNMLRSIMEKTSSFHGFPGYAAFISRDDDDPDGLVHSRTLQIMNHGAYSVFEPVEMVPENKALFRKMLADLRERYTFDPSLFAIDEQAATE